jgi:hypothetical protein
MLQHRSKPSITFQRLQLVVCVLSVIAVCPWLNTNRACAHIYDRGHIERTLDMIIRGTEIEVRYSIGLSDETMLDLMIDSDSIDDADIKRYQIEIDKLLQAEKDSPTDETASAEPLDFQTELLKKFSEMVGKQLGQNLILTANSNSVEFASQTLSLSPRNHVALEVVLRGSLKDKEACELQLVDRNFLTRVENADDIAAETASDAAGSPSGKTGSQSDAPESSKKITLTDRLDSDSQTPANPKDRPYKYNGAIRLACRTKGEAVLLNSSVAPVMARAKPIVLDELSNRKRMTATRIQAKIVFTKANAADRK